jgi:hypothetical protein
MEAPMFNPGWNHSLTSDISVSLFCHGANIPANAGRPNKGQPCKHGADVQLTIALVGMTILIIA